MPPFQPNSAGYMTISNNRETAIAIVGASSNVSKKTEIHTTRQVDGLMRMEQLDGVALAPGERLELAPGGTHLMLLGLEYRPVAGDDVELCSAPRDRGNHLHSRGGAQERKLIRGWARTSLTGTFYEFS